LAAAGTVVAPAPKKDSIEEAKMKEELKSSRAKSKAANERMEEPEEEHTRSRRLGFRLNRVKGHKPVVVKTCPRTASRKIDSTRARSIAGIPSHK